MIKTVRSGLFYALIGVTLACLFGSIATAEEIGRPIYNPESKSYFELRNNNVPGYWENAHHRASQLVYKGVRGRLAIVETLETHNFLYKNFKILEETWMGLRYWCKFRKLQWVTGHVFGLTDFSVWGVHWDRQDNTVPCEQAGSIVAGYMPVYYLPQKLGFRWQAVGASKGFKRYFVEYPTGAE